MRRDPSPYDLPVARTVTDLRYQVQAWRAEGHRIALVPTMGALHEGHLSLVDLAAHAADKVVVSVFVNPAQFAEGEDLTTYPRTEAEDAAKLAKRPTDLLFAPSADEMYPPGHATTITVAGAGDGLESAHRPHFFTGVATIVTKLLMQCMPDVAVFGEKDYQQLLVILRLTQDLNLPVRILGGPVVREADGLAMSSRNVYLQPSERDTAGQFNKVLKDLCQRLDDGAPLAETLLMGQQHLLDLGFSAIDYLSVRDADSLETIETLRRPARLLGAVRIGSVRLLDNMPVGPKSIA